MGVTKIIKGDNLYTCRYFSGHVIQATSPWNTGAVMDLEILREVSALTKPRIQGEVVGD